VQGPIVVGSDGSETSRLAIAEAATIAAGTGQSVLVVFVRHVPMAGWNAMAGGLGMGAVKESMSADELVAEADSVAILSPAGVPWTFEVREGEPATELMATAEAAGADTIVIAGRRHGAIGGLATGSVGRQLLSRWPRSLLVIHPVSGTASAGPAGRAAQG
jgi:nucleotide-binding universal stress UspA family protein